MKRDINIVDRLSLEHSRMVTDRRHLNDEHESTIERRMQEFSDVAHKHLHKTVKERNQEYSLKDNSIEDKKQDDDMHHNHEQKPSESRKTNDRRIPNRQEKRRTSQERQGKSRTHDKLSSERNSHHKHQMQAPSHEMHSSEENVSHKTDENKETSDETQSKEEVAHERDYKQSISHKSLADEEISSKQGTSQSTGNEEKYNKNVKNQDTHHESHAKSTSHEHTLPHFKSQKSGPQKSRPKFNDKNQLLKHFSLQPYSVERVPPSPWILKSSTDAVLSHKEEGDLSQDANLNGDWGRFRENIGLFTGYGMESDTTTTHRITCLPYISGEDLFEYYLRNVSQVRIIFCSYLEALFCIHKNPNFLLESEFC